MKQQTPPGETPQAEADWDAQINALIDGDLDENQTAALMAAAAQKPELLRDLEQAQQLQQLQQALYRMPAQRAPRSLRDKLRRIGQEHSSRWSPSMAWWRWGAIAAAIPVLLVMNINDEQLAPSAMEIEQGRRDLAVALAYLEKAGQQAALEIDSSINSRVAGSIRDNSVQILRNQMDTQEEYSL